MTSARSSGELLLERRAAEPCRRLGERGRNPILGEIQRRAGAPPLLRIELAELSHRQGQRSTAAEHLDADCFERFRGYRGRNLLHHLVEVFHEQILQQKRADRCGPSSI